MLPALKYQPAISLRRKGLTPFLPGFWLSRVPELTVTAVESRSEDVLLLEVTQVHNPLS